MAIATGRDRERESEDLRYENWLQGNVSQRPKDRQPDQEDWKEAAMGRSDVMCELGG